MKKIIKVFLIFSICFFTAAVSAFISPVKAKAAEHDPEDPEYIDAVTDISMLANLMIHNLNDTGKHYLIISNNYFNVFEYLDVFADAYGAQVGSWAYYASFDDLTADGDFIEYYEVADYFAQENDIDFGIFNIIGELRIFEYVGGWRLPPPNEIPNVVVMANGIYNLQGYGIWGTNDTDSAAVNQYYQKLQQNVLQKYFNLLQDWAYDLGYNDGYDAGYAAGEIEGYDKGYNKALELASDEIATAYYDGYSVGYSVGRSAGYREGYKAGQATELNTNWLTAAVSSISQVLNIQVFGSITIAMLVFFPLLVSLIFFILRLISGRG